MLFELFLKYIDYNFRVKKYKNSILCCHNKNISKLFHENEVLKSLFFNITEENNHLNICIKKDVCILSLLEEINKVTVHMLNNLEKTFVENDSKILIDCFSVNLGKMIHLGHLRSLFIGSAIKNIMQACGHNVCIESHLGDFGLNFALLLYSCKEKSVSLKESTIETFHNIYINAQENIKSIKSNALKLLLDIQNNLLHDNNDELSFFNLFKNKNINYLKQVIKSFDMNVDIWGGESCSIKECKNILHDLKELNMLDVKGMLCSMKNPKCLLTRENGTFLYLLTDIATLRLRQNKNVNKIFYISDVRQKIHFNNLFTIFDKLYKNNIEKHFIGYGFITDIYNNPLKTKENNNPLLLKTLIDNVKNIYFKEKNKIINDDIACSIIRGYDLKFNFNSNYSLQNICDDQSKNGIYILYTYTRIQGIFNKLNDQVKDQMLSIHCNDTFNLLNDILRLQIVILEASITYNFKSVFDYSIELCKTFNQIYTARNFIFSKNIKLLKIINNIMDLVIILFNLRKTNILCT